MEDIEILKTAAQIIDKQNIVHYSIVGFKYVETFLTLYYHDCYLIVRLRNTNQDKVEIVWSDYIDYEINVETTNQEFNNNFKLIEEKFKSNPKK